MRDDLRTIVDLGPVHMNGRIYDPLLGRFLSADLVVQFPGSLQSYNRYSYVENNPLTRMDPTGWYSVLGLEFNNGGGVSGFFSDLGGYGCDVVMGAVGDNVVAGYQAGTEHMTAGMTEIANANGGLDATIGGLHMIAAVGTAVGVVMDVTPAGKAEKMAVQGAEKLAKKAESAVVRAVEKAEGKAATLEKRVEGVVAGDGSKVSKAAPTQEFRGGPHGETKGPVGDGLESHHAPPDSVSPVSRDKGSAIQMEPADHAATSSHGSQGAAGVEYRKQIGEMVNSGDPQKVRDAYAIEVKDIRRAAREVSGDATKYNKATQEMLEDAKKRKLLP